MRSKNYNRLINKRQYSGLKVTFINNKKYSKKEAVSSSTRPSIEIHELHIYKGRLTVMERIPISEALKFFIISGKTEAMVGA